MIYIELKKVESLLAEFSDIFYLEGDQLSDERPVTHQIDLKNSSKPLNLKQYKILFALKGEMDKLVKVKLRRVNLLGTCQLC